MPEIFRTQISQLPATSQKRKRKLIVPILKQAKKNGDDESLIYEKLYINGQLHEP